MFFSSFTITAQAHTTFVNLQQTCLQNINDHTCHSKIYLLTQEDIKSILICPARPKNLTRVNKFSHHREAKFNS